VRELRRVLRPGGLLLVVTNGERHLEALDQLIAVAGEAPDFDFAMSRFTLASGGELLGEAFDDVAIDDVRGELVVPQVEPVLRYLDSSASLIEPQMGHGVRWDDVLGRARAIVDAEIGRTGAWRCPVHSGIFICR
jgi:SAM-dependent methyltransferase